MIASKHSLGTRCIYGHWVLGIWHKVWIIPGIGYICDEHAQQLKR